MKVIVTHLAIVSTETHSKESDEIFMINIYSFAWMYTIRFHTFCRISNIFMLMFHIFVQFHVCEYMEVKVAVYTVCIHFTKNEIYSSSHLLEYESISFVWCKLCTHTFQFSPFSFDSRFLFNQWKIIFREIKMWLKSMKACGGFM